ncbi:uncharacterized protein LOC111059491 isoform X5 [Nilaparvata lugens]|uniref:uncharacterized protein LOC111059491 isoform X5 n=1 Tax=Nilaparvata lugens TaxID=108931 RepID=UPI00193EAEC0|nr:uncharacterized protein LOC111059491 isoform X5 [Nilaparvata lugens]
MMMQMICIAVMSLHCFSLTSASATLTPATDAMKGWTVVFKLFDLNSNKYIKEKNINNFFANSENAEFFNDITKEEMYKLVNTKTKKLTYGVFIKSRGERNITTLQALKKAFPGETSVLGKDVNNRFNLYYLFSLEKRKYTHYKMLLKRSITS